MTTLTVRASIAVLLALLSAAPSCARQKWQGPSTFFRSLDQSRDGFVSLSEWTAMYGHCLRSNPNDETCKRSLHYSLVEFHCADANGDQRLSWSEYYDMRFTQTRSCAATR
jgi:EF-hand domain pair